MRDFLRELKRRKVYHVAATYAAVAFIVWQAAAIAFPALQLPEWALTLVVALTLLGFPVAVVLAWGWEVTPEGVERTGPPDGGTPAPVRPGRRPAADDAGEEGMLSRHPRAVAVGIAAGLMTIGGFGLWTALREPGPPPAPEGRLGVAVFPIRPQGEDVAYWSEGLPDLLASTLEGTPGLRIVDPWGLWQPLRPGPSADAEIPGPDRADRLTRRAGAHRYVLGAVVESGDRAEVILRTYAVGRDEPLRTIRIAVEDDRDVAGAVRTAALRLLPVLAGGRDDAPDVDVRLPRTGSPEALQAYLVAREAMRRGQFDSADVAIDRAMALDSTFVPAIVTAIPVKSWVKYLDGEPFTGLVELLERGEAHAGGAKESTRLRLQVARAQVQTDGEGCRAGARRLLRMDSTDLMAWDDLHYCHRTLGWQYGAGVEDMMEAGERVLALDPTFVPALLRGAGVAGTVGTEDEVRRWVRRLRAADASVPAVEGTLAGLRGRLADEPVFDSLATRIAGRPRAVWGEAYRILVASRPSRARQLLTTVAEAAESPDTRAFLQSAILRLDVARGRVGRVDSMLRAGSVERWWAPTMLLGVADLAGVGHRAAAERARARLSAAIPVDSAVALFRRRPVWPSGWLVAAHHAAHGDSAVTHRWREAIGELPPGGVPRDPWGALQADLDARLAARRGDSASALDRARRAYRLWDIHTDNRLETHPETSLRLHLGLLYRRTGRPDSSRAVLRSLVPPTAWFGAITARAWMELGELAREAGRPGRAAAHARRALALWEEGDPQVVGPWRIAALRLAGADAGPMDR